MAPQRSARRAAGNPGTLSARQKTDVQWLAGLSMAEGVTIRMHGLSFSSSSTTSSRAAGNPRRVEDKKSTVPTNNAVLVTDGKLKKLQRDEKRQQANREREHKAQCTAQLQQLERAQLAPPPSPPRPALVLKLKGLLWRAWTRQSVENRNQGVHLRSRPSGFHGWP